MKYLTDNRKLNINLDNQNEQGWPTYPLTYKVNLRIGINCDLMMCLKDSTKKNIISLIVLL